MQVPAAWPACIIFCSNLGRFAQAGFPEIWGEKGRSSPKLEVLEHKQGFQNQMLGPQQGFYKQRSRIQLGLYHIFHTVYEDQSPNF